MHIVHDVRFALRLLRRMPGFTATAVLTLGLGIGSTTAIYSVVHAVVLTPLPFAGADRLFVVRDGPTLSESSSISYPEFREWRDAGVVASLDAFFGTTTTLTGQGEPEQLGGLRVSGSLLSRLGVRPIVGALLSREDEPREAAPKVLIGERLWRSRFGARPDAVGESIALGGVPFTICGVVPQSFRLRPADTPPDVVMPLRLNDTIAPASLHFITAVAGLAPGQAPAQAREALQALVRALHPEVQPPATVTVVSVREFVAGQSNGVLVVLLAAVGCLLLITCVNLANLLLARAAGRRSEMAVRLALGAGRLRLMRQLLTESLVLALGGGALGVALAWLGVRVVGDLPIVQAAGAYRVAISLPVLAFALLVSLVAGVFFGLAPALAVGRPALRTAMGRAQRVAGSHRLRAALIVAEVALTFVLLAGAGLLARSFVNLLRVDPGYATKNVLAFGLSTPDAKYPTPESQTQFFETVLERLARVPGVSSVGFANERPLDGGGVNGGTPIEGRTFPADQAPAPEKRIVSPDYFRALGIRVLEGRSFTARDTAGAESVMVVSESFAKTYFPGEPAIGRRVAFNWDMPGYQTVVGVVSDVKHYGLDDGPLPMVYVSYLQRSIDFVNVVVRVSGDPAAIVPALREAVRVIDSDRPLIALETMDASVSGSVATRRFLVWLAGAFAGLSLILAATGIYGIVNYAARERTREFGIRMALGAAPGHITRLAARHGLVPIALGLVLGVAASAFATRLLEAQLFGVAPTDVVTFVGVVAGLAGVAAVACLLPALRAVRVNPVTALRVE